MIHYVCRTQSTMSVDLDPLCRNRRYWSTMSKKNHRSYESVDFLPTSPFASAQPHWGRIIYFINFTNFFWEISSLRLNVFPSKNKSWNTMCKVKIQMWLLTKIYPNVLTCSESKATNLNMQKRRDGWVLSCPAMRCTLI